MLVGTTFGPLVSPDGCSYYWLCEGSVGYGGTFDPAYAVTASGAILATTFRGLSVSRDGGCSFALVPGTIGGRSLLTVDVGPTGEVCVATSDGGGNNGVYC